MTPAMLDAANRRDTGSVVRLARLGLGMTQTELGRAIGYSQAAVSRLERGGGSGHDIRTLRLVATALVIPGSVLGVVDSTEEGSGPVDRRGFLQLGAAVAGFTAAGEPGPSGSVGRIGVAEIEQATADLRAVDQRAGGGRLRLLAVMQVRHAQTLLADGRHSHETGRRLSGVLGETAILAGWLSFDAGRHDDAAGLYREALAASGAAADDLVAAHAYANMSMLAKASERPLLAVQYAQAGQRVAAQRGGPRLRALLFAREANGHAVVRDRRAVHEAIGRAERAFSSSRGTDPPWTAFFTEAELAGVTGAALRILGENDHAVRRIRQAAEMRERARNRACWTFALADGLAATGDPVQACAVAGPALATAADLASTRVHRQVQHLCGAMTPYAELPEVRDFRERVSAVGPAS